VSPPRVLAAGESGVIVEFGNAIDPVLNARVRALARELSREPFPGFIESVPTYRSLLVLFDPLAFERDGIAGHIATLAARVATTEEAPAAVKEVPTVYDGEDLDAVARRHGLRREEVVRLHSGTEVMVFMVGFSPGFAYMGLIPEAIDTPRLSTPRVRVPTGSVGIAGRQTGIYPCPTPGGWNLIGRTSLRLFDPGADPPSFFEPGDRVRFVPVAELAPPRAAASAASPDRGEPVLEVLDGGLLTTVQDQGRPGYQRFGVPVTGAIDMPAFVAANALVGNPPGAAALECTIAGPTLRVLRPVVLAVTGADLGAQLERADLGRWPVPRWVSFFARPDNVLSFGGRVAGARAYVAVAGGFEVPEVLGSRSTYLTSALGGFCGRRLEPGDVLRRGAPSDRPGPGRRWPATLRPSYEGQAEIRVVLGPQEDYFTPQAIDTFLSADFTLASSSDRMGCRLDGPAIEHRNACEIVSDGMFLGGIQVPPDGRPIVMLADRASTGGYPKIATVIGADIPALGQLLPGDRLRFRAVGLDEARDALAHSRDALSRARRAVGAASS
jgi:KipI family sensor histidine kinase inhibitor